MFAAKEHDDKELRPPPKKFSVAKNSKEPNAKRNTFLTNLKKVSFDKTKFNTKIISWNVAGLRALVKNGGIGFIKHEKPDIFCMQVL